MKIEDAIKQKKFLSEYQKADINIMYTASWLGVKKKQILQSSGISWQQFNILRILRGQKGKPASLKLLTSRMIDKMSNTSRLVEKLVQKGLIERHYCPQDRRSLEISLTEKGLKFIREVSTLLEEKMDNLLDHMSEDELKQLNQLLDRLRTK
jgi:DNA-binding MarR family transcriptional regulator